MPTAVSRLGALIQEVARARAHAAPPPRGMPYLGLESPTGTSVHLLDALSARGVFRKYELVLDLAVDLGASARKIYRIGTDAAADLQHLFPPPTPELCLR